MSGPDAPALKPALRIEPLDAAHPERAAVIAELHARLLPTSPAVLLGPRFLRDFYYSLLPAAGLIDAAIAYVDDAPAGFVAVSSDPNGFMSAGLRRWWHRLAWMLTASILAHPAKRIPALWEAFQIMTSRTSDDQPPNTGEILSLGVRPEFTDPKFVAASGLRIARELIEHGQQRVTARGSERIFAIVDADNLAARLMYFGLGWKLTRSSVPGWRTPSVEFAIDLKKQTDR